MVEITSSMVGKKARVVSVYGKVLEGVLCDYDSALDNDEEGYASICIGNIMFFENEVESITILE